MSHGPLSRRTFLQAGAAVCTSAALTSPLLASVLYAEPRSDGEPAPHRLLAEGWQFYRGSLDPRLQVWHSDDIVAWQAVSVPHCFNAYDGCDPDTPAYRGPGWYRQQLKLNNPYAHGRTLLHFEGAGQRAEIYIAEKKVGAHSGGYDEFMVDITSASSQYPDGKVPLSVLCDNGRDIERMPSDLSDFTLYGGLYRAAHLIYVPAVSLEALHIDVSFEPGKSAHVSITARLYAPDANPSVLKLQASVFDPHGTVVFQQTFDRVPWKGETELAQFEVQHPELWSPATPNLYRCEVSLQTAGTKTTTVHRFGVRHARFEEHGPFFLNGERLAIRGTARHEDHAGYAAAMPDDLIREEMGLMKEMGANLVRLAHYQQSRLVLDLCDELGLMVWEEVPWCRSGVGTELFKQRGRDQLTAMIDQHRNHPAVVIWGLGNEDDWPDELNDSNHAAIREYMTELRDLAHRLDPARVTGYRRCDFAKDVPDVYSPSIWAGWYGGSYKQYRSALEKARFTVPHLLHVEWGADSHAGRHAEEVDTVLTHIPETEDTAEQGFDYKMSGGNPRVSRDGTWSETYACDLFDWYLKTFEELPWLTGAVQWIFKDFTTPLRVDNPVPRVNQKGLLTRDMSRKEGYFVFQSYWSEKPMLRIYGHDWPIRWGRPGEKRLVRVYSNCSTVELFLNGESCGVKHRNEQDFPAAGLRWNLAFRSGQNDLRAVAHDATLSDRVEFHYEDRPWSKPHKLSLSSIHKSPGFVTVQASLNDASGLRCLDSRAVVRFGVAGEGKLQDNLGTPIGSRVVQMYNGRAEITLQHHGAFVASVSTDGIETAFLALQPT